MAATETGGTSRSPGWSSRQLTSPLGQSGSGRLQMWKGARLHPSQHTPRAGGKTEGGRIASGLKTSLRSRGRGDGRMPQTRTLCLIFSEDVGAVDDSCAVASRRACVPSKSNWKEKEKVGVEIKRERKEKKCIQSSQRQLV